MHSFFPFIFLFIFSLMLFYAKKQFLDKLFESPQAKTGVKIFLFFDYTRGDWLLVYPLFSFRL